MKKPIMIFIILAQSAQAGFCDWHHHVHGSSGSPDPVFDAFLWTAVLIIAASLAVLFFAGPVFVIRTRRIRDLFWLVPLVNAVLYLVSISLRPYPGGFAARFRSPGLSNTFLEIALLLLSSLIVALILAVIQWMLRLKKKFVKPRERETRQNVQSDRRD